MTKVRKSHISCEAKVSVWNGGNPLLCSPAGCVVCVVVSGMASFHAPSRRLHRGAAPAGLQREQQQQRDQQREDAERLGNGKTEDQVAELSRGGRGIAQGGGKVIAEDDADADAGSAHSDTGNSGADVFGGNGVHL